MKIHKEGKNPVASSFFAVWFFLTAQLKTYVFMSFSGNSVSWSFIEKLHKENITLSSHTSGSLMPQAV